MAGMLCLMPALVGSNGKFECVLYGTYNQNLPQVKRALVMALELTPRQFDLLIKEAKEIEEKHTKELTFFTSKKDTMMLLGGAFGVWCCLGYSEDIAGLLKRVACAAVSAYIALKGYQCVYGRVLIENARLIVEAIERAEKSSVAA